MKFSEQWLREWVNPAIDTAQLAHQLTMAGLEVEAINPVAPALDKVVVGKVVSIEPHPDAKKLNVCQVDVGLKAILNIVCGAPNVQLQDCYPVALVGAELPGGIKIKKAKLRGVESFGMLCSAKELGFSEQADGLMTLPVDAPIGDSLSDYLKLDDKSIELSLTPNRGDCLSVAGIAREVGVLNQVEVVKQNTVKVSAAIKDQFPVDIEAAKECPRYVGRIIKGISLNRQTPMWLQERLRRSGLRSLGPVVDVTNYILLELGQPMHAFDLDKLQGGIKVRLADKGEKITLLDGQQVDLQVGSLLITDHQQPLALAGIMGGEVSAVSDQTSNLFLESAYFDPICIAGRARRYGLHTDSSHRFERGVDPELQEIAIHRATELLLEMVGGKAGPIIDKTSAKDLPKRGEITLRQDRINKVLGAKITSKSVEQILHSLGMEVTKKSGHWMVRPPSFRFDIELEIDLIEEIARIYGYDSIPSGQANGKVVMGEQSESKTRANILHQVLVERGYQEAITYSFVDPDAQKNINPEIKGVRVSNPISADMSVMRTSLWPGLIQAARYNLNRQQARVRLFETGLIYVKNNGKLQQEPMLGGIICGSLYPEQWATEHQDVDFFDIKADVEALLGLTGHPSDFGFQPQQHIALHPGQSARIVQLIDRQQKVDGQQNIGWVGAIHPNTIKKFDLPTLAFVFEVRLANIVERVIPEYSVISKFPAIRRDLAIVVDEDISVQKVSDCIWSAAPELLKSLKLFDVYIGKGIKMGQKSLAYGLTLQNQQCTLTDHDVGAVLSDILSIINNELGGRLRQ